MKFNLKNKIKSLKKSYQQRKLYCTGNRNLFYDIAARYLPSDKNTIIVDIGTREGEFAQYLNLAKKYRNLFLLDGNDETVKNLQIKFNNAILYKVPGKLPFETATVSYVHCSHIIEHLYPKELYEVLREIEY